MTPEEYIAAAEHDIEKLEDRVDDLERALEQILQWAIAYPLEVFPELEDEDWKRARDGLCKVGLTLDRVSASNMRHVITQVQGICETALDEKP